MHCPSLDELTDGVLKLLPRGRAWQTHEGLPRPGFDPAFNPDAYNNDGFATSSEPKSILWQYWRAFAAVLHHLVERACALRNEMFCKTLAEMREEWMVEYGLPDPCDPFPDLCTKVAAIGGTRCEYYQEIAARMGWSISCETAIAFCGSRAGRGRAGTAHAGSTIGRAMLRIVVHLNESPALDRNFRKIPRAGRLRAGRPAGCGPSLVPLKCILTRVIHAEIFTIYEAR